MIYYKNGHISKTTYLQYISLIPTEAAVHTDYAQAFKSLVNCAAIPGGYEFAWKRETNSYTLSLAKNWAQTLVILLVKVSFDQLVHRFEPMHQVLRHNLKSLKQSDCFPIYFMIDSIAGKQLKDIIRFLLTNCSKSHLRTMLSHDTQNTDVPTYIEVNSL